MGQRKARPGLTQTEVRDLCAQTREAVHEQPKRREDPTPRLSRALCIACDPIARQTLRGIAPTASIIFDHCDTIAAAEVALGAIDYDILFVDLDTCGTSALALVRELEHAGMNVRSVVATSQPTLATSVEVMRSGAVDILAKPLAAEETTTRLRCAIMQAERLRRSDRKIQRLKRMCRRLNSARQDVNRQLDVLCNDLVNAYQELADQMSRVSLASEFSSLIRQELDVESLLRTTLEFLLTKTGPTNAAVFLPTGQNDYSLGAYVNCDVPKGTADVLLDHLADIVAPRFESDREITVIDNPRTFDEIMGDGAAWLRHSNIIVFPCVHEDEPLAIAMLFRDKKNPFPEELLPVLELMRDLFAQQLGRVISIHNRHRPDHDWPGFDIDTGEEEGDDYGLAA